MGKPKYKTNQKIYYIDHWTDMIGAAEIRKIEQMEDCGYVYHVKCVDGGLGGMMLPEDMCFATKDAAIQYQAAKTNMIENKYRSEIKSVKDLVRFMYDNVVSCAEEYTDWHARKVAAEKAKELLGIDLNQ